ncbi:hypothetical protein GQ44DRAFT_745807 [Phaeosphaeriaceae sp. PMI808]|nr:hypothetical protein GQ44DRAFT_745807 [Phaeosphaeriaceae sp. PMI808]
MSAPLTTASAIGVSFVCIIALVVLLVRAVRIHKQLLADLENRGVSIAQAQGENQDSVSRPRAVLRRNTALSFNTNSGWGPLISVETFKSGDVPGGVAHYVPPKLSGVMRKASRLSWLFAARHKSGHNFPMKKIQVSRLSTVMEDPKLSLSVLDKSTSHLNAPRYSLNSKGENETPQFSQPLIKHYPAFRAPIHERGLQNQDQSSPRPSFFRAEANERLQRAKSAAAVPSAQAIRLPLRARSTSLCNPVAGKAPDAILRPLPFGIAHCKNVKQGQIQLRRIPSKLSISSTGSIDTSILASRSSPLILQSDKRRSQKITKPRVRDSAAPDLRAKVLGSRYPTDNGASEMNVSSLEIQYSYNESASPIKARSLATPKRRSKTFVSSDGSPERQYEKMPSMRGLAGPTASPKRQHSQASSRSSGGNPFQWDPTPLSPSGKPFALKRSPNARQGHRRKNSVRISLVPTYHGPASRRPDPFLVKDKEDTTQGAVASNPTIGLGLSVPNPRSLPIPPSSSAFSSKLKSSTTSLCASLSLTSPTLPLPPKEMSEHERNQQSIGSIVSLSRFPSTPSIIEPIDLDAPLRQTHDTKTDSQMPDKLLLLQFPFRPETPEQDRPISHTSLIDINCSDPEPSSLQSTFAAIPEESSMISLKSLNVIHSYQDESPPVPPKSGISSIFGLSNQSTYNLSIHTTNIPDEIIDTIYPAVLNKDAFTFLNSSVSNASSSIMKTTNSSRSSLSLVTPPSPVSAQSVFEPFFQVAFPPGPLIKNFNESPLPSPAIACSPCPSHAVLPARPISINFAQGPRESPLRPLRTSIAALRRMNSDAADAEKKMAGRGECRYLQMGREDSQQLPGEDSWLEDMEDDYNCELDEAEGRRLVGNMLDEWDEGCTTLDINDGITTRFSPEVTRGTEVNTTGMQMDGEEDTIGDAEMRMSSICEDGENFWASPPSQALVRSLLPLASPALLFPTGMDFKPIQKRGFEVAKDFAPPLTENPTIEHDNNNTERHGGRNSTPSQRYKKKSVLGVGTANVRIQVTSPGGRVIPGASGSLYDAQGFL